MYRLKSGPCTIRCWRSSKKKGTGKSDEFSLRCPKWKNMVGRIDPHFCAKPCQKWPGTWSLSSRVGIGFTDGYYNHARITYLEYLQISSSFQCSFIGDELVPILDILCFFMHRYWWMLIYIYHIQRSQKTSGRRTSRFFVKFHSLFGSSIKGD